MSSGWNCTPNMKLLLSIYSILSIMLSSDIDVILNGLFTFFTAYICLVFTEYVSPSNLFIVLFFSVFIRCSLFML